MNLAKNFSTKVTVRSAQAFFGLPIAVAWPQLAQAEHQITTFDAPGAGTAANQGTFPMQNLNSGVIVGYYVDANIVAHGFVRSPHGKYTTIDYPGARVHRP